MEIYDSLGSELTERAQHSLKHAIACLLFLTIGATNEAGASGTCPVVKVDEIAYEQCPIELPQDSVTGRIGGWFSRGPGPTGQNFDSPYSVVAGLNSMPGSILSDMSFRCAYQRSNPIDISSGLKVEVDVDFESQAAEMPLIYQRTFNPRGWSLFWPSFSSSFDYYLQDVGPQSAGSFVELYRPGGAVIRYPWVGQGKWALPGRETSAYVSQNADGSYTHHRSDGFAETYRTVARPSYPGGRYIDRLESPSGVFWSFEYGWHSAPGGSANLLDRVTHASGQMVQFGYSDGLLSTVTDPGGRVYTYTRASDYSSYQVTYPGGGSLTYVYDDYGPTVGRLLAGKAFGDSRYSLFSWKVVEYGDEQAYLATSSEHAGGVERSTFDYEVAYDSSVYKVKETSPLGRVTNYTFDHGRQLLAVGDPSPSCAGTATAITYDSHGFEDQITDARGVKTDFDYSADGRLVKKTEALYTPQERTTRYSWDPITGLIQSETVDGIVKVDYVYNSRRLIESVIKTDLSSVGGSGRAQRWSYTYTFHNNGLRRSETVDGPLDGDAVTSLYDALGNLIEKRNQLGQSIRYSNYTPLGRVGRIVGPNGDIQEFEYDDRERPVIARRIIGGVSHVTIYTYDKNSGWLKSVKSPDGTTTVFERDAAGRVMRRYRRESAGTYEVARYTYNNASQVTSEVIDRTAAIVPPATSPSLSMPAASYNGSYTITWSAIDTAASYTLEQQSNGGSWSPLGSTAGLSRMIESQSAGTYAYRVSACNEHGCSAPSAVQSIQVIYPPAAAAAINLPAQMGTSGFTVPWSAVATATSYKLEESVNGGAWALVVTVANTQATLSGRGPGTYSYRVTACNVAGCGPVSAVATTSRVDAPASAPALQAPSVNATGSYTVSWSPVAGSTYYLLDESVAGSAWAQVANTGATSVGFSGKNTSTTASYRARACNAVGCSPYSGVTAVQAIAYGANYIGQSVPVLVAAGKPFNVSWQMQNTGNTTWTSADAYSLGAVGDSFTWGTNRVGLPGQVAPGGTATIAATLTAPAAAGTYSFQWRMVRDGYTWFGVAAPNVVVTVASGSISGSPNPCKLYVGETTCTVTLSWQSSRADAEVWVTNLDGSGPQLFARAQNGTQAANWIRTTGTRFHLKSGGVTLSTIDVSAYQSGEYRPEPPPKPCRTGICQIP